MRVTSAPVIGSVLPGRDRHGRALRISAHPEAGRVVLSTWDGERCVATVRLLPADVPDLLAALAAAAVATVAGAQEKLPREGAAAS